jgi:hypothetical protein
LLLVKVQLILFTKRISLSIIILCVIEWNVWQVHIIMTLFLSFFECTNSTVNFSFRFLFSFQISLENIVH